MVITVKSNDNRRLSWTGGDNRIAQNVRNLLRTWQGEAAFSRPMGLDTETVGAPSLEVRRIVASVVRENIAEYEPDAAVLDVRVILDKNGAAVIEVDLDE